MMLYLKILRVLTLVFIAISCSVSEYQTDVKAYLDDAQQTDLLLKICRYAAKRPNEIPCGTQFDAKYDAYYREEVKKYRFEALYPAQNPGEYYFMVSRSAPSLYEKRIAIGGKLTLNAADSIIFYEESFRMFKMKPENMTIKAGQVFKDYIQGKDLSKYYPQNSAEEMIEFPDLRNRFNIQTGCWEFQHDIQE